MNKKKNFLLIIAIVLVIVSCSINFAFVPYYVRIADANKGIEITDVKQLNETIHLPSLDEIYLEQNFIPYTFEELSNVKLSDFPQFVFFIKNKHITLERLLTIKMTPKAVYYHSIGEAKDKQLSLSGAVTYKFNFDMEMYVSKEGCMYKFNRFEQDYEFNRTLDLNNEKMKKDHNIAQKIIQKNYGKWIDSTPMSDEDLQKIVDNPSSMEDLYVIMNVESMIKTMNNSINWITDINHAGLKKMFEMISSNPSTFVEGDNLTYSIDLYDPYNPKIHYFSGQSNCHAVFSNIGNTTVKKAKSKITFYNLFERVLRDEYRNENEVTRSE